MCPVTVVVAPDKFKGSLTAREAANAMRAGVLAACPDAIVRCVPMADGGEGSLDAIIGTSSHLIRRHVTGPLDRPVSAGLGLVRRSDGGTLAVVEAAQACGLAYVSPTPETALRATSRGVGELIGHALRAGATQIVLTVGGTASSDGGAGLLQALGAQVLDRTGAPVRPGADALLAVDSADLAPALDQLGSTALTVATDVTNPLLGTDGAAHVFAPQKGAGAREVAVIEQALDNWTEALIRAGAPADLTRGPGAGAGGGLAAGAIAAGATVQSGFQYLAAIAGLDRQLDGADRGAGAANRERHGHRGKIAALQMDVVAELAPAAKRGDRQPPRHQNTGGAQG
jgi:glycerate kinase